MQEVIQSCVRSYEAIFILSPLISDEAVVNEIEKIKSTVLQRGGDVIGVQNLGKKRLAYEVKKEKRGIFVVLHFKGSRDTLSDLQRVCRLQENILRFMVIKMKLGTTPPAQEGDSAMGVREDITENG